jgi:hypothetical protein
MRYLSSPPDTILRVRGQTSIKSAAGSIAKSMASHDKVSCPTSKTINISRPHWQLVSLNSTVLVPLIMLVHLIHLEC